MKAFVYLVVLALVVGGGFWLYQNFFGATKANACVKLGQLCGADGKGLTLEKCEQFMDKLAEMAGEETVDQSVRCILQSESCAAGMGCMVGSGVGAMGEFFKGLTQSLEKK